MSSSPVSPSADGISPELLGARWSRPAWAARLLDRSRRAPACAARSGALWRYVLLTYAALLLNSIGLLRSVDLSQPVTYAYVAAVHLTYCAIFTIIALAPALAMNTLLRWESVAERGTTRWIVLGLALVGGSSVQLFLFADAVVFEMYGFHMNAFVWNLISTPGGIESMGATGGTQVAIAGIVVVIAAVQGLLLAVALRGRRLQSWFSRVFGRWTITAVVVMLVLAAAGERVAYGLSSLRVYGPVMNAAGTVPFYTRARMRSLGLKLGMEEIRDGSMTMSLGSGQLAYPRTPLIRAEGARDLNVVWLVAESWRADMLTPEIMPETAAFAQRAQWFRNHYSGGNGTRMGVFSLFYGLHGQYWFKFLEASRSPVVLDTMIDANYDIDVRTSAKFTYPEWDRTLFSRLPAERMHEEDPDLSGWENDREHVSRMLESIENRDPKRPFMRFLFFESAHAPYHFPQESIVFRPFTRRMNYVTMDLAADIPPIRNSYKNACHHLDSQLARVLTYLEAGGLLDTTIVVMTGDHGEEFMEKGHWGHHSTFVEEQTRTPLVVWMPGREASEVTRLTSHVDVPPTVLAALGVTTDASEYSLGHDLFGSETRDHVVVSDWKRIAIVDDGVKIVAPVRDAALGGGYVTTADDTPVPDASVVYASHRRRMLDVMKELNRFNR